MANSNIKNITSIHHYEESDWIYFTLEDGTKGKAPSNQMRYALNIPYVKKDGTPVSVSDIKKMKLAAQKKYQTAKGA